MKIPDFTDTEKSGNINQRNRDIKEKEFKIRKLIKK
mgnify:CR=1 FL=1